MKIAYIGRVSLNLLKGRFKFDRELPDVTWGFNMGSGLVMELLRRGHEVAVITEDDGDGSVREYKSESGLSVYLVPTLHRTCFSCLSFYAFEVGKMRECIDSFAPDVVFAQWTYQNARAAILSKYPTLVVAHDSAWRVFLMELGLKTLLRAIYAHFLVMPRIRNLAVVSQHIADDCCKLHKYNGRLSVIPNGINNWHVIKTGDKEVRSEAKTIVCVSQWGRLKNAKSLLMAFAILRKRHCDWRLMVFGSGLDDLTAGKWMSEEGISRDGVELLGYKPIDYIRNVLKNEADIFCSPSLEESFGMVFVEAMSQGVPCVGGKDSGAVPWVIGDAGSVCDVKTPEELADCIESLMLDANLRRRYSANGIDRVRREFTMSAVVDAYERELSSIVKV